jgi:hypothetical protein
MLNARSIQGIIALIIGTFVAIWLGMALVTNQFETLLKVGGAALLLTAAFLGRRVWLLFIFFTSMNVALYRWAGTVELGQAMFIGFSGLLFLMRQLHFRVRFGELELWALLIIACIVQAYMRNPVGLSVFGAGNVGGRPYIAIALWVVSAAILSTLIVPPKELKWALRLAVIGAFMGIPLQMARFGNLSSMGGGNTDLELAGTRIASFAALSNVMARWVSSQISPLRACFHPFWALVLLLAVGLAAASGFRNAVASVGFIFLVAICYHGGFKSFMASLVMGGFGLALLALVNLNFPLPGNLQRALSPLPGTWEERYITEGSRSTEWRTEMWKEALTTDNWIQNKILGDGIGLTAEQLDRMQNLEASSIGTGRSGLSVQQEQMMVVGAYHSGPLHSIRMTGYVGLLILLLAMIRLAVHAHRQIMRCKGTEWAPAALFFGIPLISQPFFFTLVFGEYHVGVATTVMGMAMVRLMERNLPLPAYVVNRRRAHVPMAVRDRAGAVQNARGRA